MNPVYLALSTLAGISALAALAHAGQPHTTLGVLTCTAVTTAKTGGSLACRYKGTASTLEERYVGSAQGLLIQGGAKEVLVWTVVGPADMKVAAGALAQRYERAKMAGRPPVWVGKSNSEIVLQFETNRAAEAGSSITEIELAVGGTSARVFEGGTLQPARAALLGVALAYRVSFTSRRQENPAAQSPFKTSRPYSAAELSSQCQKFAAKLLGTARS